MNLPFFNNFNKKVLPSYFLVLVLRDEKAEAVIFEELEGIAKIVGQKEEHFSASIDEVSQDELLEKLDKAISSAESSLPENIQTQKTIFGIKESWADNDQIKKDYLTKLKKVKEELGLIPIGFLVISQAISHLLQKEEGAPISAILAEVNRKTVTVTLIHAGKNIETRSSEIHESIPFTVDTILKHFDIPEILPSRIIIFNGKKDLSQEFITHTWSKSLPFLHLPQITNLPEGFDAKAVLFGAATQMGFEVLAKDIPQEPQIQERKEHPLDQKENPTEKKPIEEIETFKSVDSSYFGFIKNVDVAKIPIPIEEENVEKVEAAMPNIADEPTPFKSKHAKNIPNIFPIFKHISMTILSILFIVIGKINIKRGKVTIIVPAILILIIVLAGYYFLFTKAVIEITIDPKIIQQDKNVLFSTTSKTDPNKNIIHGEFVSVSGNGTASTSTTGKKDIGNYAKGTITIFNLSKTSKSLPNGTEISSSNGLIFVLDNAVSLASASSSIDSNFNVTTKPSTINVTATASSLGKDSNLPSGTKFNVERFDASDLIAKNDNPFSGGTKKEITVVSKNDSIKLESDIPKQLENKAKQDLIRQIGKDKVLLPIFISNSLSKELLSAKIGDETNQLSLTATVEFQGIIYGKEDLITFSKSLLEKNVSKTQEIDYNNIKTNVKDIKNKNDEEIDANLNIKALLLPRIDKNNLAKSIRGKSFKNAENIIYKLSQVANVNIVLSPKLPLLPKNLPSREKNILILIKVNG